MKGFSVKPEDTHCSGTNLVILYTWKNSWKHDILSFSAPKELTFQDEKIQDWQEEEKWDTAILLPFILDFNKVRLHTVAW